MLDTMEFKALGSYKNELYKLILYNDELSDLFIDLMMPTLDDDRLDKLDNFLGGNYTLNTDTGTEKVNLQGRMFDVPFVYSCVTDTLNVLCMDTNISRNNVSTKEMTITLYVMCHRENLTLDSETKNKYRKLGYVGRNRLDIAVAILGDMINHARKFGIGELNPVSYNPIQSYFPNNNFFGKVIVLTCNDFMTDYAKRSLDNERL